jgi:UDP-4-amino-4,6-dideoxy-N-acetyl-beta-L-altrosamine transaminase
MTKLAISGGTPVRDKYLPYGQHWIDDRDIAEVSKILRSEYLTTGPKIKEFEEKLASTVGSKYAVAFSSGTAALHGACFAAGIKPGDEVVTTPLTFAASANCVLYQGGSVVFADVKLDTYNINPEEITRNITSKTKAIIPVDFTGQPVELHEINKIAQDNNLIVIEDGAHALGAEYKGLKIGSLSDMTAFSFHPVKHIAMGEGGAVTTNNIEFYEKLYRFRTHGITRDPKFMAENHGPWYYEQIDLGYNYRITDIQTALGYRQLEKLEKFVKLRRGIIDRYNQAFKDLEGIIIPKQHKDSNSSWHIYVILLELKKLKADRRQIYEALQAENIGVNVHYIPVYYHPYYKKLGYNKGLCPNTEFLYERLITLPLFPKMSDQDVNDVIEAVNKVIGHYKT